MLRTERNDWSSASPTSTASLISAPSALEGLRWTDAQWPVAGCDLARAAFCSGVAAVWCRAFHSS